MNAPVFEFLPSFCHNGTTLYLYPDLERKYFIWFFFAAQLLLLFVCMYDPFYGDAISTVSRAAWPIYEHNLGSIWYLPQNDPGHPTLFPWLLALIWKITSPSLPAGHILTAAFALLLVSEVYKLSALFVSEKNRWLVLLLLFCMPVYLAQSTMVLTHLPLTAFFVWAFRALQQNKRVAFWIASLLMVLTHLEAAFLLAGLGLAQCFPLKNNLFVKQFWQNTWLFFLPAFTVFLLWGYAHHAHTGWYYSSPVYSEHRSWAGVMPMVKSFALIGWRMLDYGNFAWYVLLCLGIWKGTTDKTATRHLLFAFGVTAFVMAVFMSKSIAHRYFLPIHVPALALAVQAWEKLEWKRKNRVMFIIILTSFSGNWWVYPGKCIGDATLAYRSYFGISKMVNEEFPNDIFYTYAPLTSSPKFTTLNTAEPAHTAELYDKDIGQIDAVLQSNCNCEFTPGQLDTLKQWKGKSYEHGAVYVNLLFNPASGHAIDTAWQLRKPSAAELWMEQLKHKLK